MPGFSTARKCLDLKTLDLTLLGALHLRNILMDQTSRCYQTGFTFEKPTLYSAPNANSKMAADGSIDVLTQDRALLNKVSK